MSNDKTQGRLEESPNPVGFGEPALMSWTAIDS